MTQKPKMKIVTTATEYNNMDVDKYREIIHCSKNDYFRVDACKSAILKFLANKKGFSAILINAVDAVSIDTYIAALNHEEYAISVLCDAICIRITVSSNNRIDGIYEDLLQFMQNGLDLKF